MPECQFADSRLKMDWANKHIANLELWLADLPKTYTSSIEIDPAFRYKRIKHDITDTDLLSNAALRIGDAVHNLKCALDYAWIETLKKCAPRAISGHAKFPVCPTKEKLESDLRGKGREIDVACPDLFRLMIDRIQPYDGGNFAIWPVYVLNNRDKHRLLIPTIHYSNINDIEIQDKAGNITRGSTWGTTEPPPYFIDFEYDLDIKNKGKLSLSIGLDQAMISYAPGVKGLLPIYARFVFEVIETLEAFIETI